MKRILLAVTLLIAGKAATGQIHYHNIIPDTTISTWDAFQVMPSTSLSNNLTIWWHPSPEMVVQTQGDCEVLFTTDSLPAKLNLGDSIGMAAIWVEADYHEMSGGGVGKWTTDAEDKYLGFRFKNAGSGWYYGWLKMSVGAGAISFTVSEWGYNTQAGKAIKAGQMGTTGVMSITEEKNTILFADRKVKFANLGTGQSIFIIADISGRELYRGPVTATDVIDMSGYPTGIYVMQLLHEGYVHNLKVALQ